MAAITPEQIVGTQFEIWMEKLLRDTGRKSVLRNVIFARSQYVFRQVDLLYFGNNPDNPLIIFELKYSRRGPIHFALREEKHKAGQLFRCIDTLTDEVEERRRFVQARKAVLVTNTYFEPNVYRQAKSYGTIDVCDGKMLESLIRRWKPGCAQSLEEQIRAINIEKYDCRPNRYYLVNRGPPSDYKITWGRS